ncbi:phosphoenolpyruvate--protein phosphotransferase [Limnohabitans sp. DM1]|uniref:phosphoenolpyruvate--protein phosphotransferase n=1 Tax=Limnohabitans sp. DM1 TaxID=1597955 RepID=UPI000A8418F7|nr:phosphoenolpyruvate--protein phosphotransferase [Limnohabitans sp. DM1]
MGASRGQLVIMAPLSGVLVDLESVPDPVFAQKLVGDGVSIDPTSDVLLAPVAGTITQLHKSHHALTITTAQGVEVLLHLGVDTVTLKGEGFTALVHVGDAVSVGQALVRFDMDFVARNARSLLTQVVVANVDKVSRFVPATGLVEAGQSVVLTLELADTEPSLESVSQDLVLGDPVVLPSPAGLHARPAAVLAAQAKQFQSDIRLVLGTQEANAKSLVAIMGLGTAHGDVLHVKAQGVDAAEAVRCVSAMLAQGCGEEAGQVPTPLMPVLESAAPMLASTGKTLGAGTASVLAGVSASPGLVVGQIVQWRAPSVEVVEQGGTVDQELAKLEAALAQAHQQIDALKSTFKDAAQVNILAVHQALLEDPDLLEQAIQVISQQKSAAFAWQSAFINHAERLENLQGSSNALLRERGKDIRDVGRRVLGLLAGVERRQATLPEQAIVMAEDLSPSDIAGVDRSKLLGFCTVSGGATSHAAILARSFGIPAICGVDQAALSLAPGTTVVLDGDQGLLYTQPSAQVLSQARQRIAEQADLRAQEKRGAQAPASTTDGQAIDVVANVRNLQETQEGVAHGAQGVGLLRSEFLFDDRASAPDENEQAAAYMAIAQALGPQRSLVVRTLDVGGDKPLSYLPIPPEANPFLGMRGIRVSLDQPEMLRTQLRAILRAAPLVHMHIMFPMVALVEELRQAKAILAEEQKALGQPHVRVGMMLEVPSAAVMAEQFAREVDFFSIGTNDLTQYTLAMDRGHPKLAKLADGFHPSVLKMIAMTCAGARQHGKWVGVCGGMASDRMAVPVLMGLGVRELSVSVPAIAAIKAWVRSLSLATCQALAQEVLQMSTSAEVRARLASFAEGLSPMQACDENKE